MNEGKNNNKKKLPKKRFHCFSIIADLHDTVMKKMAFPNGRSKSRNKGEKTN